jgi:hypothetical protein
VLKSLRNYEYLLFPHLLLYRSLSGSVFFACVGVAEFEERFGNLKGDFCLLERHNIQNYIDWGKTVVYKLERGEGECAV